MGKKNNRKFIMAALAAVVILGIFLRFYDLNWEAFSWNEGTLFGGALEYARGNFVYNFNDFVTPPLMKYFGAIVYSSYGFSEALFRSISAVFGTATIILTFYFVRRFYDIKTALFASAMVAFSIVHLAFSRMYLGEAALGFFYLSSVFIYFRILESKKPGKLPILLGASLALALLTKYLALYLILFIVIHAIATRSIRFCLRDRFSLEIEKYLLKTLVSMIFVFFLLWPFSLYPITIHADVTVVGFEKRTEPVTITVPQIILSPQEYITAGLGKAETAPGAEIQNSIINVPILGYFSLFAVKENIIFSILFILGIFAVYRMPCRFDKSIALFIAIFLVMEWLQKYGFSYRYLTVMMPFFAIIAARPLQFIKKENIKSVFVIIMAGLFFANSVYAFPAYTRHYNQLDALLNLKPLDGEIQMLDGYREGIEFVNMNCKKVGGELARSTVPPDATPGDNILFEPKKEDIPFCLYVVQSSQMPQKIQKDLGATCRIMKTIEVDGVPLRSVYYCE